MFNIPEERNLVLRQKLEMVHCIGQDGFPSQEGLPFMVTDLEAFDFTLNTF
jgi:hypothetical protein